MNHPIHLMNLYFNHFIDFVFLIGLIFSSTNFYSDSSSLTESYTQPQSNKPTHGTATAKCMGSTSCILLTRLSIKSMSNTIPLSIILKTLTWLWCPESFVAEYPHSDIPVAMIIYVTGSVMLSCQLNDKAQISTHVKCMNGRV